MVAAIGLVRAELRNSRPEFCILTAMPRPEFRYLTATLSRALGTTAWRYSTKNHVSWPVGADAQRANCEAPERTGADSAGSYVTSHRVLSPASLQPR